MTWIRTQTNSPDSTLVNLAHVATLSVDRDEERVGVYAHFVAGDRQLLTYFDGPGASNLGGDVLVLLWHELKCGVRYIDMAALGAEALHDEEEANR